MMMKTNDGMIFIHSPVGIYSANFHRIALVATSLSRRIANEFARHL